VAKGGVVRRMQEILNKLGIPLCVEWVPDDARSVHGEIRQGTIYIYDCQEEDAFATFTHEVIEFKLKEVTRVYRVLINNLIDGYEKLAYQQKEDFIEFIPRLIESIKSDPKIPSQ
jgi:hypothetical protein